MADRLAIQVGMGQILVEGGHPRENLARAVAMVAQAAAAGCQIVVLPECLDLGWAHPDARRLAELVPGDRTEQLGRVAIEHQICVVAGLTERDEDRIYNAAVLLSPEGRVLLKHRKINLLLEVEGVYDVGDRLSVARTPLGMLGILTCADNFPDSLALGHAVARMGAQAILSPCAWAVPPGYDQASFPYGALWKAAYGELARLYGIPIVGVSNVGRVEAGPWAGWKCIGCSLAVGPDGLPLDQAPYGESAECLRVVRLELAPPRAAGTQIAPMLRQRGYEGP